MSRHVLVRPLASRLVVRTRARQRLYQACLSGAMRAALVCVRTRAVASGAAAEPFRGPLRRCSGAVPAAVHRFD